MSGYGREQELEADGLGARYLADAGYDPIAMLEVIRVLADQERNLPGRWRDGASVITASLLPILGTTADSSRSSRPERRKACRPSVPRQRARS